MRSITSAAPTVYALMGINSANSHGEPPLPEVVEAAKDLGGPVEKCLIVPCDAIGVEQITRYPDMIAPVEKEAPLAVNLMSMVPSVTPVCYASVFSGATPDVHGIRMKGYKPVLSIQTLYDILPAAGRKMASAAVLDCSIDLIFQERPVTYFRTSGDEESMHRGFEIMNDDSYDCMVVYLSDYDDTLHKSTAWADDSVKAMYGVTEKFARLGRALDESAWGKYRRAIIFAPDHGAHTSEEGKGAHGTEMPEDMLVRHYYGLRK